VRKTRRPNKNSQKKILASGIHEIAGRMCDDAQLSDAIDDAFERKGAPAT